MPPPGVPPATTPPRPHRFLRHVRVLRILWRVTRAFGSLWPWHVLLVIATIGGISAELVEPWLHKSFVNRVLLGHRIDLLPDILGLYAAAAFAQWLAHSAVHYAFVQSTERFSVRLRVAAYRHLRRLGLRSLRRVSTGEATAALQQFGPEVGEGYLALMQSLLASLYRLPASLALLAHLNGPLLAWTLPALALYPLYPLITTGPLRRALTGLALFDVQAQGVVTDQVAGLRAMLHRLDATRDVGRLHTLLWRRVRLRVRAFLVDRAGGLLDILAHQGITVLLLGVGGLSVLHGRMEVGDLLAFLEYVRGVEGPVRRLMHLPIGAQRVAVVAERVFELLDAPVDVPSPPTRTALPTSNLRGQIRFQDAGVRTDDGRWILRHVTFEVPPGRICAVVGGSGAGKSTLGALIPRHLDPDEGQLLIDGQDARTYNLGGLRAAVGVLPQDPLFFRESVLDNVRLGLPEANDAEVRAALDRAHAADLLTANRPGGRTLQEGGGNLSGGQRQRLALARAYLQDPQVYVLDEATSALDPQLQRRIVEDLLRLRGRATVVFITHQLDLAARADLCALLEDGRLVRFGPPAEVLREVGR